MRVSLINQVYQNSFNNKKEIKFSSDFDYSKKIEYPYIDVKYWQNIMGIKRALKDKSSDKQMLLAKVLACDVLDLGFDKDVFSNSEYNEIIKFALNNPQALDIYKRNLLYATKDLGRNGEKSSKYALLQRQYFVDMTKMLNSNPKLVDIYSKFSQIFAYFSLDSEFILELFKFDNEVLDEFISKMVKLKDELDEGSFTINQYDTKYILQALDLNNIDNYIDVVKHEYKTNNKCWFTKQEISKYVNPYTGKFESSVYWEAQKLGKQTWRFSPVDVINSCFEYNSKGLSKDLLKCAKKALTLCECSGSTYQSGFDKMELSQFVSEIKDADNCYSENNKKYAFDFLKIALKFHKKRKYVYLNNVCELLKACKDNNGLVDSNLAKYAKETLLTADEFYSAVKVVKSISSYKIENRQNAFDGLKNITNDKKFNLKNFDEFSSFCLGKNGEFLKENFDFLKQATQLNNSHKYSKSFLSLMKNNPKYRGFALEMMHNGLFEVYQDFDKDFIGLIADKNGDVKQKDKERLFGALKAKMRLDDFCDLYNICKIYEDGEFADFYDGLYNSILDLVDAQKDVYFQILKPAIMAQFMMGQFDLVELEFSDKIRLAKEIECLQELTRDKTVFNKELMQIYESLNISLIPLEIHKTDKFNFIKNILSANDNLNTEFENVFINSIDYFKSLDNGLELSYSKERFLSDLVAICSCDKIDEISQKLNIELISNGVKYVDYNGILQLNKLDLSDELESKIYDISHKFMYENLIFTENLELDSYLNQTIKALPEFINIIGKKQHQTHNYTLDIHILLALAYSLQNPNYHNLSQKDKSIMKFAILLHDISKEYAVVDENHPKQSANYARKISSKIFRSTDIQDRIYELILNHHWSKTLNTTSDYETVRNLAFNFRRPNDFQIAKIMANSDIKAVNDRFYETYSPSLSGSRVEQIEQLIYKYQKAGNLVYSHKIVQPSKLEKHKVSHNNREYTLINLCELDENTPVSDFGFPYGLVKKDLRFLVHMVDESSIKDSLNALKFLSVHSDGNEGVLSESIITPLYKRTYGFRNHGVILSQSNNDIIFAAETNKHTGTKKTVEQILRYAFDSFCGVDRSEYRKSLFSYLKILDNGITQEEFAKFYSKYLANLSSLAQINPNKTYSLAEYDFKGSDLINALVNTQNELIDETNKDHNEILGYIPKIEGVISKSSSIKEVPIDVLEFAYESDLPIILI